MIRYPASWLFNDRAFDVGAEGRTCSATGTRTRWLFEITSGDKRAKICFEALRDQEFLVEVGGHRLTGNKRSSYLISQRGALEAQASRRRGIYHILRLKEATPDSNIKFSQLADQLKLFGRLSPKQVALLDKIAERAGVTVEPECWPIDLKRKGHLDQLVELMETQPSIRERLQRHQVKRIEEQPCP